jgi:putative Mg2+ transporter-C (MgtC) family protein
VTGIGFLGAGTIIRSSEGVKGLTTAASVWVSSAIGLAVGCGYYSAAIIGTITAYLALSLFKRIEKGMINQ